MKLPHVASKHFASSINNNNNKQPDSVVTTDDALRGKSYRLVLGLIPQISIHKSTTQQIRAVQVLTKEAHGLYLQLGFGEAIKHGTRGQCCFEGERRLFKSG